MHVSSGYSAFYKPSSVQRTDNLRLIAFKGNASTNSESKKPSVKMPLLLSLLMALGGCGMLQVNKNNESSNLPTYNNIEIINKGMKIEDVIIMQGLESELFQIILEKGSLQNMRHESSINYGDGRKHKGISFEKNDVTYVFNQIHKDGEAVLYKLRAGDYALTMEKQSDGSTKVSLEKLSFGPLINKAIVESNSQSTIKAVKTFFEELNNVLIFQHV